MNRRTFLKHCLASTATLAAFYRAWPVDAQDAGTAKSLDARLAADWLKRWQERILGGSKERFCDHAMGEDLGWLMSPFLNGFYYGYLATHDTAWLDRLVDWTDSWIKRGVEEPGGYLGWPQNGSGIGQGGGFYMDSLLGEAMAFRPVVIAATHIQSTHALRQAYGERARAWLELAGRTFAKWDSFDCWREVKGGGVWVVPEFGLDPATRKWTDGYAQRATTGFSNPDNKQNIIARWLLAMHGATGKPVYRDRAEKWFRLMKSRMHTQQDVRYFVWNYWEPAGPWDYKPDGSPRHWIGVHPNGGYYEIDVDAIVDAYDHGLVFTREDVQRLVATNRDFMWNQKMNGARFQRIDGGQPDPRWQDTPGKLWTALVPHDQTLRKIFLQNFNPASWDGLSVTPWFIARGSAKES